MALRHMITRQQIRISLTNGSNARSVKTTNILASTSRLTDAALRARASKKIACRVCAQNSTTSADHSSRFDFPEVLCQLKKAN